MAEIVKMLFWHLKNSMADVGRHDDAMGAVGLPTFRHHRWLRLRVGSLMSPVIARSCRLSVRGRCRLSRCAVDARMAGRPTGQIVSRGLLVPRESVPGGLRSGKLRGRISLGTMWACHRSLHWPIGHRIEKPELRRAPEHGLRVFLRGKSPVRAR